MSLTIINHKNHKIDNDLSLKLENAFNLIRKEENLGDCSVNLKIVDNVEMEDLNKKYRNKDASTNVLSFTNKDISKKITNELGDIAISYEYVIEESAALNKEYDDHIIHMLIHGIYHILGFDHENDNMAKTMEDKEIALLSKLKITNPYICLLYTSPSPRD